MAYITTDDMIERFSEDELIELTDRDNNGDIDESIVNTAIDDASAEIDSYLTSYKLPLSTVPDVIVAKCADIARYLLYTDDMTEQVQKRYDDAIKYLINVAKGVVSLGLDESDKPSKGVTAKMTTGGRVFARNSNGFI